MALSNLRLRESLHRQSIREPLTGLFNRRHLDESLNHELARCARSSVPLSLLMLDVATSSASTIYTATAAATACSPRSGRCWRRGCAARTSPDATAARNSP